MDAMKLGNKVEYVEVDYRELEELVEQFYPDYFGFPWGHPQYTGNSIVADNEWGNDTKQNLWLEGDNEEVEMFLNNNEEWQTQYNFYKHENAVPSYNAFLEDLYALGIIEEDHFLVDVCW